jgi:hypothetical protein
VRFHPADLPALVLGLSGCLSLGGGCASALRPFTREHVEIREYKPLSVPAVTAVTARWQRLEALAAEQAWRTETMDVAHGLLIASRPVKGSAETPESSDLREHVRVRVGPTASEIAVQTEVLEDGEWDLRDFTSGRYEYSRESEIAHRIEP